jgi:hypothetical protein
MYIPNFPEDSVLRRHFDSTVSSKRDIWLQSPPSDSILRRHAAGNGINGATRPSRVRRHSTHVASASSSISSGESKGFFARLIGLFTGKG